MNKINVVLFAFLVVLISKNMSYAQQFGLDTIQGTEALLLADREGCLNSFKKSYHTTSLWVEKK